MRNVPKCKVLKVKTKFSEKKQKKKKNERHELKKKHS